MFDIFNTCISGKSSILTCVSKLVNLFHIMDAEGFQKALVKCISIVLVNCHHNVETVRAMEIFVNFTVSPEIMKRKVCGNVDDSIFEIEPIFQFVIRTILAYHNADSKSVRYQVCNLISKVLESLPSDAKLDINLLDDISERMLKRLRDFSPRVRVKAANALSRIQDPEDPLCPVIEAYTKALVCDRNFSVRKAVLLNMCITSKSLSSLLSRVQDKKPVIRLHAYERISKAVPIKALKIDDRTKIMSCGFTETVPEVRSAFQSMLIRSWFHNGCNQDLLSFVHLFNVEEDRDLISESVSLIIRDLDQDNLQKCIENIQLWLSESKTTLSLKHITMEKTFLWCRLVILISSQAFPNSARWEHMIPEISDVCNLIEKAFNMFMAPASDSSECCLQEGSFIINELSLFLQTLDLGDEVGRKIALDTLLRLLQTPRINLSVVSSVVKCYMHFSLSPSKALDSIIEIISEIRQPIAACFTTLDVKQDLLSKEVHSLKPMYYYEDAELNFPSSPDNVFKEDTEILHICLAIASEVFQKRNIDLLSPSAMSLLNSFILPLVQDQRADIRVMAVRCLAICCVCTRQLAQKFLLLLTHIVELDTPEIRIVAINALFDIFTIYGPSVSTDSISNVDGRFQITSNTGINFLFSCIAQESKPEILFNLVAGFCKLLLFKRISSDAAFSALIMLYLDPKHEEFLKLKRLIGQFFRIYSIKCYEEYHKLLIPACFSAFQQIMCANEEDSLASVEINHIVNLFSNLTSLRPESESESVDKEQTLREEFIVYFLNKLQSTAVDDKSMLVRHGMRVLSSLNFVASNGLKAREISAALTSYKKSLEHSKDTRSIRYITKIEERLSVLCSSSTSSIPT